MVLTATRPLLLLAAVVSSTESGEQAVLDIGVIGLGDNTGAPLLWIFTVCLAVVCSVEFCSQSGAFTNFHSGASDTRVVTSLEKNSSIV